MKSILFPFDITHHNQAAFNQAMDLAKADQATLIFLTCLQEVTSSIEDAVYFHLLELQGQYQTYCNDWQAKLGVRTKQVIKVGTSLEIALPVFLQENVVDFVVPTKAIK